MTYGLRRGAGEIDIGQPFKTGSIGKNGESKKLAMEEVIYRGRILVAGLKGRRRKDRVIGRSAIVIPPTSSIENECSGLAGPNRCGYLHYWL